eukprot:COSAG02_NODE_31774_length_527_cov_1.397196_1_plen_60_part_01
MMIAPHSTHCKAVNSAAAVENRGTHTSKALTDFVDSAPRATPYPHLTPGILYYRRETMAT